MTFCFLPLTSEWLDAVLSIEKQAHSHPWADSLLRKPPGKFNHHYVMLKENELVGYFYAQCVAGEATLLNIAVAPLYQGKGVGRQLLNYFLQQMREANAQEVWLEVRESNLAAIHLYESMGFNQFDRRFDYYPTSSGREDALIMSYGF